jgi:hypothetical protein
MQFPLWVEDGGARVEQPGVDVGLETMARCSSKHDFPPRESGQKRISCQPPWLAVMATSTVTVAPLAQVTCTGPVWPPSRQSAKRDPPYALRVIAVEVVRGGLGARQWVADVAVAFHLRDRQGGNGGGCDKEKHVFF